MGFIRAYSHPKRHRLALRIPRRRSTTYHPQVLPSRHTHHRTKNQKHHFRCIHLSIAISKDDIGPGGRHDNDFPDFREIAILPTTDELASTEAPFLRPSSDLDNPNTEEHREALHLDNQFRLMREDMIYEMREELQISLGKQKGKKRRGIVVDDIKMLDINLGDEDRRNKWAVVFQCLTDLPQLQKIKDPAKRKASLRKDNVKLLKNQSLACLLVDEKVLAFPSVRRDEDLLAKNPPEIVLEFEGETSTQNFLLKMKSAKKVKLIQIDVALFSYEPILTALKRMKVLPLAQELLFWKDGSELSQPLQPFALQSAIHSFERTPAKIFKLYCLWQKHYTG